MSGTAEEEEKKRKKKKHKKEKKQKKSKQTDEDDDNDAAVMEVKVANADEEETPNDSVVGEVNNKVKVDRDDKDDGEEEEDDPTTDAAPETGAKKKRKRKRKRKGAVGAEEGDEETGTTTKTNTTAPQDAVSNTVFVEGIPFDATREDVQHFFVSKLDGKEDVILELRLPTWQDTGRLRGFGHVRLATPEAYQKALALSGQHMGKRYLTIQPAKETGTGGSSGTGSSPSLDLTPPEGCLTLYINNLPYTANETDISTAFTKFASSKALSLDETNVRIARNSVSRHSKGFCYVDFSSTEDLKEVAVAASKRPLVLQGRALRLDYDTGRVKGSFRTDSGRLWAKEKKEMEQQQQQRR